MDLEPYKDIVQTLAEWSAKMHVFAPAFMCKNMIVQGNTDGVPSGPFVGGIGMSLLILKYGYVLNDPAMISANKFGFSLSLVYLSIFLFYCKNRIDALKGVFKVLCFITAIYAYAYIENQERLKTSFGILTTVAMLSLITAPLFNLKKIINDRDTSELPLPMIINGTIVTSLWLLYGIIIKNVFLQFQNAVILSLCLFQLGLIIKYRKPAPQKLKKED